jgi:hypothetical protein
MRFVKIKIVSRDVSGISQARKSGQSPSELTLLMAALQRFTRD